MPPKKIAFLTGTRADFGKLKPLMNRVQSDSSFELHVFVTGMHMLRRYGSTHEEVRKSGFTNVHLFMNQNSADRMDHILAKTIIGLSDYMQEIAPDLLVIHGDRVEALAGASVGTLNNIRVGHVEGGEVSGTVDELIRHAVTKLSHLHFVANTDAQARLQQLGEREDSIYVIGSPDIDVMNSSELPPLREVRKRYGFGFHDYAVLLFHPVTTELHDLRRQARTIVEALLEARGNFIVIYPNNDHGTEVILEEYGRFEDNSRFKLYPSIRFEYFLSLLKHATYIIGNSSAGVREAPHFGVPAINLGSRQNNRAKSAGVIDSDVESASMRRAISRAEQMTLEPISLFGNGKSADLFHQLIRTSDFWKHSTQKHFVDRVAV
jgi:UDP-N-acetylglucosamine 2-epimerase (hydrolysing)